MIYEFYGRECPHCISMKPVVERLKSDGLTIESFEVWHDENNAHKLELYERGLCGGVPFYLNPKSKKWICGATTYETLKELSG